MTTLVSADGRWQWNGHRWKAVTNAEGELQHWTQSQAAEITELNTSPGYNSSSILSAEEEAALESAFAETSFFEGVGTSIEGGAIVGDASGAVLSETTGLLGAEVGAGTLGGTIPVATGAGAATAGTGTALLGAGGVGLLAVGGAIIGGTLGSGSGTEKNPNRAKGHTLPGHHFIGPGNDADEEDPVDKDDEIAKKHDHAYKNAVTHEDVRKADEVAIKEFHDDWKETGNIHSLIGRVGIQLKHAAEGQIGVKYPSISGKKMPQKYRWKFDRDNWPDQRVNWDGMSRSQKAYTIKQYNRARKTQGLRVVPNPFSGNTPGFINPDRTETITPKTPGKDPIRDIGSFAKARPGHGPIIDSLRSAANIADARQRAIEADEIRSLNEFFLSDEGKAYLESLAIRNDEVESEQFSGGQAPTRELPPAGPEGVAGPSGVQTRGQKRQQEEQGQGERPPPPAEVMAGGDRANRQQSGGSGDAMDTTPAGRTKSAGKSGEPRPDGGFDSAQGPEGYIPTGGYQHGGGFMVFEKVHQLKSFAIPHLNLLNGNNEKVTTTPMAEIPWDKPLMYMSEAEFNLIPPGSHFTKCEIAIHNIVSSTQYPTGGAAASTATFNHPKIGVIGFDLESKCRGGKNFKYVMSSTNEMQVTEVKNPEYGDFVKLQYGTDQSSATWDTDDLPGTMFPIPYNLYNYFSIVQPSKAAAATQGFTAANAPGYENYSSQITQFNLNDRTWDEVFRREYSFQSATIGKPFKHLEVATNPINQSVGNNLYTNIRRKVTNIGPAADLTITESFTSSKESGINTVSYMSTIEQGSNLCIGDAPRKPARQPSIHFGMKAIPKLSSLTNASRASEFVHSEVYFIVKAKIFVSCNSYPNRFIQPKTFNVPIEGTQTGTGYVPLTNSVVTWNLKNDVPK